jgi:hypothetical protein
MAKESISQFVSPEESGVALKSSNPVASCFRNQWRDLSWRNSRGDKTAIELFIAGIRGLGSQAAPGCSPGIEAAARKGRQASRKSGT